MSVCKENNNIHHEYLPLLPSVPPSIRYASIALGKCPDAVNLWLGNHHSVTSLHRDSYENIYCQILGAKHFDLLPPIETACVNECFLPLATWEWDGGLCLRPDGPLRPGEPEDRVPCAVWDPDQPDGNPTTFSHLSRPIRARLGPGDMLYLPACW